MSLEQVLFALACLVAMAGAFGAAVVRNLLHAALLLGMSLTAVAALYFFLQADYLACVQLVVYVGGVLVLILFGALFSADLFGSRRPAFSALLAGLVAASAALVAARSIAATALASASPLAGLAGRRGRPDELPDPISTPGASLGDLLVGDWLPAFLATAVLLTAVLVAAVATVRRSNPPRKEEADA